MQDPDIPPQVVEGNTNGAADGVHQDEARVARWAATARSTRASLPLQWLTATAPIWAWIMATAAQDRDGPAFPRPTRCSLLSLYPLPRGMPLCRSSPCLKHYFS